MQNGFPAKVEEKLAYLEGLVDALIFMGEHAEDEELPRIRNTALPLLYILSDQLRTAEKHLAGSALNHRATN